MPNEDEITPSDNVATVVVPVERDELYEAVGRYCIENDKVSIGNLMRYFKMGFNQAASIVDQLAEDGVIGPYIEGYPRQVLMTVDEFDVFIGD